MEPAEKLSITLPANLARIVRQKVESGAYASNSEVIREALRDWQERDMERVQRLAKIRQDIEDAISDPRSSIPAEEVFARLRHANEKVVKTRRHGT
jgi:antitoxin ParD1/3/4